MHLPYNNVIAYFVCTMFDQVSAATAINPGASAAATPYMLSPGMSLPHSSKVVYLPSSGLSGTSGYLSSPGVASNPTIVMDQAGRQYIINNPSYNAPMQYQVAAPSAYKVLMLFCF